MLRDVIESAGLAIYAEIGLILLFVTFLLIVARIFTQKRDHYERLARIPFDDESASEPVARSTERSEV
jgi:cbb3-type cytochrome oxidase subunit 3